MKTADTFILPERWCVKHSKETLGWIRKNAEHNGNRINQEDYYYFPCDSTGNNSGYHIPRGYREITFEQFQKHVLKQNNMERKIIGYKTPFDLFGGEIKKGTVYPAIEDSGSTHPYFIPIEIVRTWEPVYEEPVKVGDYIYFLKAFDGKPVGYITKITRIDPDILGKYWITYRNGGFRFEGNGYLFGEDFRLATEKELESYYSVVLEGHKAIKKGDKIAFGCHEFTIAEIQAYKKFLNCEVETYMAVGRVKITKELLDKLLELI